MEKLSYKKDKKKLTFQDDHTIGNSLYPLSEKKHIGVWSDTNTIERKIDPKFHLFLSHATGHEFRAGRCYNNAEAIRQIGEASGLDIAYYSGWLFPRQSQPLHHAWNVLNGKIIIDSSVTSTYIRAMDRFLKDTHLYSSEEEKRGFMADIFAQEERKKGNIADELLYSSVPKGFLYIGTKDKYEPSINRFQNLLEKHPRHPSYQHKRNPKGESPVQEILINRGVWN